MDLHSGCNPVTAAAGWRPGMEMASSPLERFTQEWKDSVDKTGEEWRAYCEAVACLRRYFRTRFDYGREVARQEFRQYLDLIGRTGKSGERATSIEQDFQERQGGQGRWLLSSLPSSTHDQATR